MHAQRLRVMPAMYRCLVALLVTLGVSAHAFAFKKAPPPPLMPSVLLYRDTAMLPLEPLAQLLAAELTPGEDDETTIAYKGKTFQCKPGTADAMANGKAITLPAAPLVIRGTLYLPAERAVTALGGRFMLSEPEQLAFLSFPGMNEPWQMPLENLTAPFDAYQDVDSELYFMRIDGSGMRRLSYTTADESDVAFSVDDAQLIFRQSDVNGTRIRLRPYASPYAPLVTQNQSTSGDDMRHPLVSPDLKSIFYLTRQGERDALYRINLPGNTSRLVAADSTVPCWTIDRRTLIITSSEEIHTINPVDGALRTLTSGTAHAVSPNGKYLLLSELQPAGDGVDRPRRLLAIRTLGAGADAGQYFRAPAGNVDTDELHPSFSADSARVVFVRKEQGLFLMSSDRSALTRLTEDPRDQLPRFTPDGSAILFLRDGQLNRLSIDTRDMQSIAPGLYISDFTISADGENILFSATPVAVEEEAP